MTYRKIGETVTDENGRAVINYSGTGAGLVELIAETTIDGSIIQSEIYSLIDCGFYDDGITSTSNGFIFNTTDIQLNVDTVGKTGTTVSNVSSTTGRTYWANKKGTPSTVDLDWDYPVAIECDILNGSSAVAFQFGRQSDNQIASRTFTQLGLINGGHLKVTFDGTNVKYFVNSETPLFTVPLSISGLCAVRFYCPASSTFKYKNFMIYPI